eukprot:5781750-Pyramimonas_sp.AAC.1
MTAPSKFRMGPSKCRVFGGSPDGVRVGGVRSSPMHRRCIGDASAPSSWRKSGSTSTASPMHRRC